MIEVKDICFKRDNKEILKNVSLKIDDGELVVITGPNGSGKSTLAKIIMGIETQDSGKILFNGTDISKMNVYDRAKLGLGFAFQQPVKFKGITVYDIIQFAAGKKMTEMEACSVLSKVGLCAKEYIHREVDSGLSGGELKRIEIATVFVRNPKLTIMDEPEAGIDLWSFKNLIDIFEDMKKKLSGEIIIISHQERILNIADRIILMDSGKISKIGKKDEVFNGIRVGTTACCKLGGNENE